MSATLERLTAALADRYRIERELGQGGMATVFLSEDLKHGRKVALKVLKPELAAKVKEAFFSFDWTGSTLLQEFGKAEPAQEAFMPITYKQHWAVVRDIDKAMNVSYTCK